MVSTLSEVLSYQNDEVVFRFSEDYDISTSEAEEIFTETKRWLWLCGRQRVAVHAGIVAPSFLPLFNEAYILDMMWHTFLLFTKDYSEFCMRHFGFFIHHTPQTREDRDSWRKKIEVDQEQAMKERRQSLRGAYEFICDELGVEALKRWCEEYPMRFRDISKIDLNHQHLSQLSQAEPRL